MTSSVSAPSATPSTVPEPPRIATPPTTTAAITVSSKPSRDAGVDGGVARGPQRAVEAGEQARAGEGAEHAPARHGCR